MRLHAALALLVLLALCAFATEADAPFASLAVGKDSCSKTTATAQAGPYGVRLAEFMRVTCELDDALRWADQDSQDSVIRWSERLRPAAR